MTESNVLYDIRALTRELNELEPGMKNAMVREAKAEAKPIVTILKQVIPKTAPLSGMSLNNNPTGRLAWGGSQTKKGNRIPANSVTVKFRTGRSRTRAITSLVAVWVNSPMTAIADVAGKGNMRKAKKITSEYAYKGRTRRHRVTTQGETMIRVLKSRNLNNFVYPNVEDQIDNVSAEVKLVIERYARKVNRKLN
jgi:hypothetical protein